MPSQALDLVQLPKLDIHRHLEGCIRPRTAYELGQQIGVITPDTSFEQFRNTVVVDGPRPLLEVLKCFDVIRQSIKGEQAVACITREAIQDAAQENTELCELRYSPLTLAKAAGLSMAQVKQAVCHGVDEVRAEGVATVVTITAVISRRHGVKAAWEVVRHLEQDEGQVFVGVDFASDELRYRSAQFIEVAQALAKMGLALTIHTGEGVGPEYVADALSLPGVTRLAHAVSLAQDSELMAEVRDRGVLIEVCPTSNVRTGIVSSYAQHPARQLLDAGLRIALCTDDPTLFDIDLGHELRVARDEMGLTDQEIEQCQAWARQAAFRPAKTSAQT